MSAYSAKKIRSGSWRVLIWRTSTAYERIYSEVGLYWKLFSLRGVRWGESKGILGDVMVLVKSFFQPKSINKLNESVIFQAIKFEFAYYIKLMNQSTIK